MKATFNAIVKQEIGYRGLKITGDAVPKDAIRAAICIIGKGVFDHEEYPLYMQGTKAISTHIFRKNYSGEIAGFQACKVICLSACVLTNQNEMVKISDPSKYMNLKLPSKRYAKLSYVRKLSPEAYAYLVEEFRLLSAYDISV